jgi:hypothetical protein
MTNYSFRPDDRRWRGWPSARVNYRRHVEFFARQPEFEVVVIRNPDEAVPTPEKLDARLRDVEYYVDLLIDRFGTDLARKTP